MKILAALGLTLVDLVAGAPAFDHHEVVLIKDGVPGEPVSTADASVTFTDLDPGQYVCTAVSLDTAGNPMAPLQTSSPVTIPAAPPAPPSQAKVVTSITLTLDNSTP